MKTKQTNVQSTISNHIAKALLIAGASVGINFNVFAGPIPPVPAGFEQEAAACAVSESGVVDNESGALLVGTVVSAPWYVGGKPLDNVVLSHTHVLVAPLGDSNPADEYEMAADNVFASGYDKAEPQKSVPAPLSSLTAGTIVEVCGLTYTQKPSSKSPATNGIHWVHIKDAAGSTGGWVKTVDAAGNIGANLEDNTEYLYLWPSVEGLKTGAFIEE